jgi:hypothetical protein
MWHWEKLKYYHNEGGMSSRDTFCQDLREYLERYVDVAKRYRRCCVAVSLRKMLRKEGRRRYHLPYAKYLKKLFGRYMYGRGVYIIPLEDAENMLKNIDALCESLRHVKQQPNGTEKEKMLLISFHLPREMLNELNRQARHSGVNRSELVRKAIAEMLEKYKPLQKP